MFLQWSTRHWLVLCILILVIGLVACGNEASEPEVEGSEANSSAETADNNDTASTPIPSTSFSANQLDGKLIFTQDRIVYSMTLGNESEPTELALNIDPQALFVSPDQTTLYYAVTIDSRTIHIIARNLTTDRETLIAELRNQIARFANVYWDVTNWSPDGEWFQLIATRGGLRPMVVSKDGSTSITIGRSINNWVTWLEDGTGLVIRHQIDGIENRDTPFPEIQLVEQLDTSTQERTVLELDLESIMSFADLEAAINTLDLALAQTPVFIPPNLILGFNFISWRDPEFRAYRSYNRSEETFTDAFRADQSTFEGMICSEWEILRQDVTDSNSVDTLYTANEVALISDVSPVMDGGGCIGVKLRDNGSQELKSRRRLFATMLISKAGKAMPQTSKD